MEIISLNPRDSFNRDVNDLLSDMQASYDNGDITDNIEKYQKRLDDIASTNQKNVSLGRLRYKLYETQAYLYYFRNDNVQAKRFIREAVRVRGEKFDRAVALDKLISKSTSEASEDYIVENHPLTKLGRSLKKQIIDFGSEPRPLNNYNDDDDNDSIEPLQVEKTNMKDNRDLKKFLKNNIRLVVTLIALLLIGFVAVTFSTIHSVNSKPTSSHKTVAKTVAKPVVTGSLPNLNNTSTQNDDPTNNFVVAAKWGIEWNYDCTNDSPPGNFSIFVQNPNGSPSNVDNEGLITNGYKGNGVQQEDLAGTYQLAIFVDPGCTWNVQVVNNSGPTTISDESAPSKAKPVPTTAQQVATWNNKYGSIIGTISNDLTKAGKDGNNDTALETDCTQIFNDSIKAQALPAIPDATVNTNWQAALDSFVSGAQQCQYYANDGNTDEYNQATADFTQGNNSLEAATSAIQKLQSPQ